MKNNESIFYLLKESQAAPVLGVSPRTLADWRRKGKGPRFVRISRRCIRYRPEDLQAFAEAGLRDNTSQS